MVWVTLAMMVASIILQAATASKTKTADATASSLSDFDMPQTEEGTPQAVLFGEAWSEDWQVLGFGDFRTAAVKAKSAKK